MAVINSTPDFLETCFKRSPADKDRIRVFYRGSNHRICTNTPHIPGIYYHENYIKNESAIFNEVISVFPQEMLAQKLTVEKLILMQHYRFPTRILDISRNPLIALFFACFDDAGQDYSNQDGIVNVYAVPEDDIKCCDSDTVTVLANLCRMTDDFSISDLSVLSTGAFNKNWQIQDLLHRIQEDSPGYLPVIKKETFEEVVCLRPRMNNPRIIMQEGCFFLFGIRGQKTKCAVLPEKWIEAPLTIPANAKSRILKELGAMGLNEGFVYPDFEHVSHVIKGRYDGRKNVL
jgi:hypothetical protein